MGVSVPLIHSWTTLDPSGSRTLRADPLWGSLWDFWREMVPDGFEQT